MKTAAENAAAFKTPNAMAVARWYLRESKDTKRALDGWVARGGKL